MTRQAEELVAGMASILLPLADSRDPQPLTAGPPELPDLVRGMLLVARETPAFASVAMLGTDGVSPGQWRAVGGLYVEIGDRCYRIASDMDRRMCSQDGA
jgi:hypothetical protein